MLNTVKTLVLAAVFSLLNINLVGAQITPDNTLGSEKSTVREGNINGLPSDVIEGGATRGGNLFHSFKEFNIQENRGAYFNPDSSINNVLTRVTGGNVSNIMGTLGVIGNANLFLLNPNGIVFGPKAKLDVNGSFLGTTADSILFNNYQFSATEKNPAPDALLTINIPIGLQLDNNQSKLEINTKTEEFKVKSEQFLTLIGGDITFDGAVILSPDSNINLGGLLGAGEINLTGFIPIFPNNITRGNVTLSNGATVNVRDGGNGFGSININSNNLELIESSGIIAGIGANLGDSDSTAGDININATGDVTINKSNIENNVSSIKSQGNAGNINITANTISSDKSNLDTANNGKGNGGNVTIKTEGAVTFDNSDISASVNDINTKGGDITIESQSFYLINHSQISATNFRQDNDSKDNYGSAGNVTIKTNDFVTFDNDSNIYTASIANPSNILIETAKLTILNSQIESPVLGDKNGGNLTINATDSVELSGKFTKSGLQMDTMGDGNAGNIEINTNQLIIKDGTSISTRTLNDGKGNGGNIIINVTEFVSLSDLVPDLNYTNINSNTGNQGNGGDITINTHKLTLQDGSSVSSQTLSSIGNAGNLEINASEIELIGPGDTLHLTTFSTETMGSGNAGNISINTDSLLVKDEGVITSKTSDSGDAGDISINTDSLWLKDGGVITSETTRDGKGGNVEINASNFVEITGKASYKISQITTNNRAFFLTQGLEGAGDIIIKTPELIVSNQGQITANTSGIGNAGNIILDTQKLTLFDKVKIEAFTTDAGNAGSIIINSPEFVDIGKDSKINVETSAAGSPGNINITTENLNIGENAQLSATATVTSTNTAGGGSINLDVNNLNISGKLGIFAETNSATPAGNLTIKPLNPDININFTENGFISASTKAIGDGGNITITAPEIIDIQGLGKISVETSGSGNAGNINLESKNLNINNQTEISASTTGSGKAGSININADNLNLTGNATIKTDTFSSGNAGDIHINVKDNLILNDSKIAASTAENSTGKGGSIFIDPNLVNLTNSTIAVSSQGLGTGGNIQLTANTLNLDHSAISAETNSTDGGSIELNIANNLNLRNANEITATAGKSQDAGNGGNINLNADFIINYPDNNKITANAYAGNGGNIIITTNGILGPQYLDITASSELGLQGNIEMNIPKTDPASGLVQTEKPSIDIAALFAKDFCKLAENSSFVYIGRGGRILTIDDTSDPENPTVNWIDNPYSSNNNTIRGDRPISPPTTEKTPEIPEIRQAQGWVKLPDGTIVLTAHPVEVTPMGVKLLLPNCN